MIYLKWLVLAVLDIALLLTVPLAAPVIAAFTKAQPFGMAPYTWGGWWGTYDNPPQGDEGYCRKRAPFIGETEGWRGYLNRAMWMIRNPMYGFARLAALDYSTERVSQVIGHDGISDKDGKPGWYFVRLRDRKSWEVEGFEFYGVFPWLPRPIDMKLFGWTLHIGARDLRIRLGWKILTDKFASTGFAPLVNTINPLDGYGEG